MFQILDSTPIAALTVSQFRELMNESQKPIAPVIEPADSKKYAYGIAGIRKIFKVSHGTAMRYKDSFLQPAVKQNGRVIITDIEHALRLFDQRLPK